MIKRIQQLLTNSAQTSEADKGEQLKIACAALLVEIMVIDRKLEASEESIVLQQLEEKFDVTHQEARELFSIAKDEVKGATSLYQFTRAINDHYGDTDKFRLIEKLWRVAFADGLLDKHEEAMIRRIAELIHVPHNQFIRAKKLANIAR